jgi:hypothetical protein
MSTKFEQLLDLLVNEEMDKANDLFHEIVVDKSREIYENLIAEEDDEMEEESADMEDESVEEAEEEQDESVDENVDLEDSYDMESDNGFDQTDDDATGELGQEIGADDDEGGEEFGGDDEGGEDSAIMDIKNAIQELEAAFAELEQAHGSDEDEMGFGDEEGEMGMDGEEEPEDEMMGRPAFEGKRMTREYVEKVGNDWEKNSQKTQGQYAGSGSGEKDGAPQTGKSPIASGKNKPGPAGVNAKNLNQGATEGQSNTGTSPGKVNKGITPEKSEQFTGKEWETNSKAGGNAGVKNLKKVGAGYPGNNKTPGPVGSGTGDKAGQTSGATGTKQFLPQYK